MWLRTDGDRKKKLPVLVTMWICPPPLPHAFIASMYTWQCISLRQLNAAFPTTSCCSTMYRYILSCDVIECDS